MPLYAKVSLLGKKIIYFDMAITPTLGITKYDGQTNAGPHSESGFGYGLDLTQWYFFSKHFALRVDFRNRWFREKLYDYTAYTTTEHWQDNTFLLIGGTYFF